MPAIRRLVNIAASPRDVWNGITTPEGLSKWLVREARIEPRSGGRVVFISDGPDGDIEERGIVHLWKPASRFEIVWERNSGGDSKGSTISFQVARDGEETRVGMVQSGGESLEDPEIHARLSAVWRKRMDALQAAFDRPE